MHVLFTCYSISLLAHQKFLQWDPQTFVTHKLSMKLEWLMCYHLWHELWAMAYGFQLTSWCSNKIEIWLIFQCIFKLRCCLDPNELPFVSMIHVFLHMVNLQSTLFWAFRIFFYIKHEKLMFLVVSRFNSPIYVCHQKWNPKTLHLQKQIDTNRWFVISKPNKKHSFHK